MRLTGLLVAGGDSVIGLIRNPDHAADLAAVLARLVYDPRASRRVLYVSCAQSKMHSDG
jgi:hypothetical protein